MKKTKKQKIMEIKESLNPIINKMESVLNEINDITLYRLGRNSYEEDIVEVKACWVSKTKRYVHSDKIKILNHLSIPSYWENAYVRDNKIIFDKHEQWNVPRLHRDHFVFYTLADAVEFKKLQMEEEKITLREKLESKIIESHQWKDIVGE